MVVRKIPENAENVIEYSVRKNVLSLNDFELSVNLAKKERDDPVHLDFCFDYLGGLINGVGESAQKYVAQVDIPARQYEDVTEDNPDFDESKEESAENPKTVTKRVAKEFSMDNVTLTLWELKEA